MRSTIYCAFAGRIFLTSLVFTRVMINAFRLFGTRSGFVQETLWQKQQSSRLRSTSNTCRSQRRSLGTRAVAHSVVHEEKMTVHGSAVAGLQPANVWEFFEQLTKIPRPSKHEDKYVQA